MVSPVREPDEPDPRTRVKSFALLFGGFAIIVSMVIFLTEENLDLIDSIFVGGFPVAFATLGRMDGRSFPMIWNPSEA